MEFGSKGKKYPHKIFKIPRFNDNVDYKAQILKLSLKSQKIDDEINELQMKGYSAEELDEYIKSLHRYNELKDVGQMLLGKLATCNETTTKDLYKKYGLELSD